MKKLFKFFAGTLMTAALSFALAACDKDNDDPEPEPQNQEQEVNEGLKIIEDTDSKLVYKQNGEAYDLTMTFLFGANGMCTGATIVAECKDIAAATAELASYTVLFSEDKMKVEGNTITIDATSTFPNMTKMFVKSLIGEFFSKGGLTK